MATGKSGDFTLSTTNFTAKLSWKETYDVESNISVVSITSFQLKSSAYSGYSYFPNGTIKINGSTVITFNSALGTHTADIFSKNTYHDVKAASSSYANPPWSSGNIAHNSDGSKTVAIALDIKGYSTSGGGGSGWRISGSQNIELTTIPRASTLDSLSCSSSYFNGTLTYKYTPQSASYYNKCNISLNLDGEYISIKSIDIGKKSASQQTGTVTLSSSELSTIYSKLPKTTKGILRFTLRTYSDSGYSTQVGNASYKEVELIIPTSVAPKLGTITLDPVNITTVDGTSRNILVQSKNKLTINVSGCEAGSGSTIKSYKFEVLSGSTVVATTTTTSTSVTLGPFSNTGDLKIRLTVTDNRRSSSNKGDEPTVTCYTYGAPSFSSFKAYRCNSDGTADDSGTYIKYDLGVSYQSVNNTNKSTVKIYYKNSTANSWTAAADALTSSTTKSTNAIIKNTSGASITFDAASTYMVYATVTDNYNGSVKSSSITVFGASRTFNIRPNGSGIAFGKMAETNNLFESKWPAKFDDTLTAAGAVTVPDGGGPILNGYSVGTLGPGESIPSNSDLNDYMTPGVYYSDSGTTTATLTNTPFTGAGFKLIVEYIGGANYIRQKLYPRGSSCMHYERYYASGTWYVWREFSADDTTSYLPLSGGTLTGKLTLASGLYYSDDTAGIDCNNSDIIDVGGIFFNDAADSADEGINFYRSSNYWDTLYAKNGELKFHPNRSTSTGLGGNNVYHNGTFKIETGTITLNSTSETTKTFTITTFGGVPNVVLTPLTTTAGIITAKVRSVSKTSFAAIIGGDGYSGIPFRYIAIYGNAV